MTDKGGIGVTVVSHDSENKTLVAGYEDPGSYWRNVTYNETSLIQLASLTASSSHCEQFIKYECYQSLLLSKDIMYGWWVSRDNENMTYCYDCNCNKNDRKWREDSVLLTDKSKLPVIQMRFGDTGEFVSRNESGYHTLGKLECYGLT